MLRHHQIALLALAVSLTAVRADEPYDKILDKTVNPKMAKLFGSGGIKGLVAYGTGIVVDKEGYILTVASHLLDTKDLRVHLSDGRRYSNCKVVAMEPELDVALVKIDTKEKLDLPFFDAIAAAKKPMVRTGTKVLAFSNQFEIATRDEPMSIQRSLIQSITKLQGRRGIHEVTFNGNVYVLDAITNNPGAAGGALTTRDGELLGIVGKELKNELSNTWINYAIPIQTSAEVVELDDKKRTVSIVEIVEKKEKYNPLKRDRTKDVAANYTGLTLVPNVVEFTPPFVEEIAPESPASKAGVLVDDLIVYVDGEQIASINELNKVFSRIRPDTPVKLEVRRGDKLQTLNMTMGKPLQKKAPPKQPVVDK
jgi:serine protease Do